MGKKRIFRGLLAASVFCCAAIILGLGAQAVQVTELAGGMTLAPGTEVTVPDGDTVYSYVYDAGSYGELKEPISGQLQPGDTLTLLTEKKAKLTVYEGWQFSGWYCVLRDTQLTVFAQYSTLPSVTLSERAAKYGLEASAQRMSPGGEVTVTVPEKYAGYVLQITVNGEAVKYKKGVYTFTMPDGNAIVDVVIRENMCLVQFDANGGEFEDGTVVYGEYVEVSSGTASVVAAQAPQRKYYIFAGWESKLLICPAGQRVNVTAQPFATVVFRAKWTPDPDTAIVLTLDLCGGSVEGEGDTLLIAPGGGTALPGAWRDGYSFLGWNTKADGSGDNYLAGESFSAQKDTVLYARWQAASCTVTISIKHLGKSVADISTAVLIDAYGNTIMGQSSGTGVFVFSNVPDGEYRLQLTSRSASGECGGIVVQQGKVVSATLQLEMWD